MRSVQVSINTKNLMSILTITLSMIFLSVLMASVYASPAYARIDDTSNSTYSPTEEVTDEAELGGTPNGLVNDTPESERFGLTNNPPNKCGSGDDEIKTSFDFGCNQEFQNGIMDLVMAILRQIVNAVGIVLIAVAVFAGIQYGASRGDPNMVTAAKKRLFNVFVSLFIFLLSFSIINFIVPGFIN